MLFFDYKLVAHGRLIYVELLVSLCVEGGAEESMQQGRGTLTDQLTNVIQVIQLGRKSGRLTVERGEGLTLERGEILFEQGRITHAQGGSFSGQQAINWFSTWGACRFLFVPMEPGGRTTKPLSLASQTPRLLQETNPTLYTLSPGMLPTGPLPANKMRGVALKIPQRICPDHIALDLIEQAKYSRLHRHIFLLIDGRRDTAEIVRLVRKGSEEVQQVLLDLEQIHVIR